MDYQRCIFIRDLRNMPYNTLVAKYGVDGLRSRLEELDTEQMADTFALYLKLLERDLPAIAIEQGRVDSARQVVDKHIGTEGVSDNEEIDYLGDGSSNEYPQAED